MQSHRVLTRFDVLRKVEKLAAVLLQFPFSFHSTTENRYLGKAVVNALQLISILKGTPVKVLEPLRQHDPELEKIASEMPVEPSLFPMGLPPEKK